MEQQHSEFIFKDQIKVIRKLISRNKVFSPDKTVINDFAKFEKIVPKHSILYKLKNHSTKYYTIQRKNIFSPNDKESVNDKFIKVYENESPTFLSRQKNFNGYNYFTLNSVDKNNNLSNFMSVEEPTNIINENYLTKPIKKINESINNTSNNNKVLQGFISPSNMNKNINYLEYSTKSPLNNKNIKSDKKNKNSISRPQISTQFNSNSNIINIENNIFGYSEYEKKNRISTDLRSLNNNTSEYSDNKQGNNQSKVCLNEYGSENSSEYYEKMKFRNIPENYNKYTEKMQIYRKKLIIEFLKHFRKFLAYYLQRLFINLIQINKYNSNNKSKKYLKTEGDSINNKCFASINRNKYYKNNNFSKLNLNRPKFIFTDSFGLKTMPLNSYESSGSYVMKTFDTKPQNCFSNPYKRMKMFSLTKKEENTKIQIGKDVIFKNNNLKFDEQQKEKELCRNSDMLTKKYEQIIKRKKNKNSLPKAMKYTSTENANVNLKNNLSVDKNLNIIYASNNRNENNSNSCSYIRINRKNKINKNGNTTISKEFKNESENNSNYSKTISVKCNPNLPKENQNFSIKNQINNINIDNECAKQKKDKKRNFRSYKRMNLLTEKNKELNQIKTPNHSSNYYITNKVYKMLIKNIHTADKRLHIHINYYFLPQNKKNNKVKFENIKISDSCSLNFIGSNTNLALKKKKNNSTNNRLSLIKEEDPSIRDSKVFDENDFVEINNHINEFNAKNTHKNKNYNIINFCDKIFNLLIKNYRNDFFDKLKKIPRKIAQNKFNDASKVQINPYNINSNFGKRIGSKIYVRKKRTETTKITDSISIQKLFLFRDLLRRYVLKNKK